MTPNQNKITWFILALIPLVSVFLMWLATNGIPYNTDSNETFSAFVQGENLLQFNPAANAFLTDDAPAKHAGAHPFTYTHGPNLPRFISAALMLLGVNKIEIQVIISAIISILLSLWFLSKSFPEPLTNCPSRLKGITLGMFIAFLFGCDFLGVIQFLGNLWRTWHFPLFLGCIWAARTRPKWYFGFILYFLLIQLEFLFAFFTLVSVSSFIILKYRASLRELFQKSYLGMACGAMVSLLLFISQLIFFYGWDGFLYDLKSTYLARNTNSVEWESIRQFYEANGVMMWPSSSSFIFPFHTFLFTTWQIMIEKISLTFSIIVVFGFISSIISLYLKYLNINFKINFLNKKNYAERIDSELILISMLIGYCLLGLLAPGYTLNGYAHRWAPLLVFPVLLSIALCVSSSLIFINSNFKMQKKFPGKFQFALVSLICIMWSINSFNQYILHPNFVHKAAKILETKYRGHTFVSSSTFPHMISHYTRNWAYYSPEFFSGENSLDQSNNWNADRLVNPDYLTPEYFLCEQMPYYPSKCADIAKKMIAAGHEEVERTSEFIIFKLNWNLLKKIK